MLKDLQRVIRQKGYKIFNRQHELNIVGLRTSNNIPNAFDDTLFVFHIENSSWRLFHFPITTDPGLPYLQRPLNASGTAILKPNQYIDAYGLGLHRGLYQALVQIRPVTVIRDANRDNRLDFHETKVDTGMFGINIHRAEVNGTAKYVADYSAGCQVFSNSSDFGNFIAMCQRHKNLYGNKFTYTLLDERDFPPHTITELKNGSGDGPLASRQQSLSLAA